MTDLLELHKYVSTTTSAMGWQLYQTLENILETTTITPELQSLLKAERIVSLGVNGKNYTVTNATGSTVLGNAGVNTLIGSTASDQLYGFAGDDTLTAVGNGDLLDGGDGDDVLTSNSTLMGVGTTYIGGKGNDTMTGAYASDSYIFNLGDGQDTISDYSAGVANTDTLSFGAGIAPADVTPVRSGLDLIFKLAGSTDQITVKNWFSEAKQYYQIEQVKFADNTIWTNSQINAKLNVQTEIASAETINRLTGSQSMISGLADNDILNGANNSSRIDGSVGDNTMAGQVGSDTYIVGSVNDVIIEKAFQGIDSVESTVSHTLSANVENMLLTGAAATNATGNAANDLLVGSSATNVLPAGSGDDCLDGKAGADTLIGGVGNATYVLGEGYGAVQIIENGTTSGNTDVAIFGPDIVSNQLLFAQTGNDQKVSVIGTTDKISITNWYLGSQSHVEQFKSSDGKTLLDSRVQSLVDAMAAFSPPVAGQITLTTSYTTSPLNPVIAASWQE
ncbi:Bifunctional hemolysin/adenylate cyclase precursor [compost metagenome]